MIRGPDVFRDASPMDVSFTITGRQANRNIFQRSAVTAHRMALKMRQHQHGIIIFQMIADKVFLDYLSAVHRQFQIAVFVENIDGKQLGPAMLFHCVPVGFRRIALSFISGVAFHDRAVYFVDHRFHEFRTQKVLVADFAAVQLHRDLAFKLPAENFFHFDHFLRSDDFGKIDLRFFHWMCLPYFADGVVRFPVALL